MKIELEEELDVIDDHNWAEWSCNYSRDGVTWHKGFVQSDGHDIAEWTLEDEAGRKILP